MATTQITCSMTVAALPDNAVWFANAAAWSNYWLNQSFKANIPIAGNGVYGVTQQATTVAYAVPANVVGAYTDAQIDIDGSGNLVTVPIPNKNVVESLISNLNSLMADYAALKLALKNAGIISAN